MSECGPSLSNCHDATGYRGHRGPLTAPALLLLHGFPETSVMWREVGPLLSAEFAVVAADLPGYEQKETNHDCQRTLCHGAQPDTTPLTTKPSE
jgi:pimeloyl-ACP methyl ester carboxylesterase